MGCLFVFRNHNLLLSVSIFWFLVGCSKQVEPTGSVGQLPVNQAADENEQDIVGEQQMGRKPKYGFKEYVKNPDLFRKEGQEIEDANAVLPPNEKELKALVAKMGQQPLSYEELQKLKKAGEKAVPLLQPALRDEKFLFHRYGESVLDGSSIETALDLLEPFGLPDVNFLEPALKHPDEFFRYHALYHLARCGNDDAIDALSDGLKSKSEKCRTWTLMGLGFLKKSARGSKKFRQSLFEAVLPLLTDKEFGPREHAPRALLALDLSRAKEVLLAPDIFSGENRSVNEVLQALNEAKVSIPGPQLRGLMAAIKKKATNYPFDYAYAESLLLLAQTEGPKAGDLIADAENWGNETVKEGASEASAIAAGVTDAYEFVIDIYERKSAKGLSEPQLYYLTLSWLDAEVCNGGFSQYYFNSSGELAGNAVKAAKAVGAPQLAEIIQEANALFGKNGPDQDRDKRMDQLSKIDLKALEDLDDRYFKCPERLREKLPKFVASHAQSFKPTK